MIYIPIRDIINIMSKEAKYAEKLILWISQKQKKELENLAKELRRTKSDLVREAISKLLKNINEA